LNKYSDLKQTYGYDTYSATIHYITTGYSQGRTLTEASAENSLEGGLYDERAGAITLTDTNIIWPLGETLVGQGASLTYKYNIKNLSSFHLFIVSINFKKKITKDLFFNFLKKKKINCQFHYIPIYKFNLYNKSIKSEHYKGAEYYFRNSISLPIFYNLNRKLLHKILYQIGLFLKLKL
jgi:hypothetical protein